LFSDASILSTFDPDSLEIKPSLQTYLPSSRTNPVTQLLLLGTNSAQAEPEGNDIMAQCTSLLSWDGILCECCRQLFDSHIVDTTLAMRKSNRERECHWWHDISTLKRCASQRCRFCALVLANFNSNEHNLKWLNELASWDIRLTIRIMDPTTDACHVYIYAPTMDPRPLSLEPPDYGPVVTDVCFKTIGGKTNSFLLQKS
jgi:hypothetical protein